MTSKLIYPILFINICQSLLVNLNLIQENYILLYFMICYEIIILMSFVTYLYYNSKHYLENEKHKKLFIELNELNEKYKMEIKQKEIKKRKLKLNIKNIKTVPNKSKLSKNKKKTNVRKYYSDILDYRNNNICIGEVLRERKERNNYPLGNNNIKDTKVLRIVTL